MYGITKKLQTQNKNYFLFELRVTIMIAFYEKSRGNYFDLSVMRQRLFKYAAYTTLKRKYCRIILIL